MTDTDEQLLNPKGSKKDKTPSYKPSSVSWQMYKQAIDRAPKFVDEHCLKKENKVDSLAQSRLPPSLELAIDELLLELGVSSALDVLKLNQKNQSQLTDQLRLGARLFDFSSHHVLSQYYARRLYDTVLPDISKHYHRLARQCEQILKDQHLLGYELLAQLAILQAGQDQYIDYVSLKNKQTSDQALEKLISESKTLLFGEDKPYIIKPNEAIDHFLQSVDLTQYDEVKVSDTTNNLGASQNSQTQSLHLLHRSCAVCEYKLELGLSWLDWLVLTPKQLAHPEALYYLKTLKYEKEDNLRELQVRWHDINEQKLLKYAASLYKNNITEWVPSRKVTQLSLLSKKRMEEIAYHQANPPTKKEKFKIFTYLNDYINSVDINEGDGELFKDVDFISNSEQQDHPWFAEGDKALRQHLHNYIERCNQKNTLLNLPDDFNWASLNYAEAKAIFQKVTAGSYLRCQDLGEKFPKPEASVLSLGSSLNKTGSLDEALQHEIGENYLSPDSDESNQRKYTPPPNIHYFNIFSKTRPAYEHYTGRSYATLYEDLRCPSINILPDCVSPMVGMLKAELGVADLKRSLAMRTLTPQSIAKQLVIGPYNVSGLKNLYASQLRRQILPKIQKYYDECFQQAMDRFALTEQEKSLLAQIAWLKAWVNKVKTWLSTQACSMSHSDTDQYCLDQGQLLAEQRACDLQACCDSLQQAFKVLTIHKVGDYQALLYQAVYASDLCARQRLSILDVVTFDQRHLADDESLKTLKRLKYADSSVQKQFDREFEQISPSCSSDACYLTNSENSLVSEVSLKLPIHHYLNHLSNLVSLLVNNLHKVEHETGQFYNAFQAIALMNNQLWQFLGQFKDQGQMLPPAWHKESTVACLDQIYNDTIRMLVKLRKLRDKVASEFSPGNEAAYLMLNQAKMMQHQVQMHKVMPREGFSYSAYYNQCISGVINSRQQFLLGLHSPEKQIKSLKIPEVSHLQLDLQQTSKGKSYFFHDTKHHEAPKIEKYKLVTEFYCDPESSVHHSEDALHESHQTFFNEFSQDTSLCSSNLAHLLDDEYAPTSSRPTPNSLTTPSGLRPSWGE